MSSELMAHNVNGDIYAHFIANLHHENRRLYDPDWSMIQDPFVREKIQREPKFKHAMQLRVHSVAGRNWTIIPAGESALDELAARITEEMIEKIDNFSDAMLNLASATLWGSTYGFVEGMRSMAATELAEQPKLHWWLPKKIKDVDKRRIRIVADDELNRFGHINTHFELMDLDHQWKNYDPRWFIRHVYEDIEGRLGYGRGLVDSLYYYYYMKTHILKTGIQGLERWAQGQIHIKMDGLRDGPDDEPNTTIINSWTNAVEKMISRHVLVYDSADQLEVVENKGTGHQMVNEFLTYLDDAVTQLILGSNLPTGGTKGGSFALGKVQEDVTDDIIHFDRQSLSETISKHLVGLLWERNSAQFKILGITDNNRPKFSIGQAKKEDPEKARESGLAIIAGGVPIIKREFYERTGWTEPKADDEIIEPPSSPEPQPGLGGPGGFPFQFGMGDNSRPVFLRNRITGEVIQYQPQAGTSAQGQPCKKGQTAKATGCIPTKKAQQDDPDLAADIRAGKRGVSKAQKRAKEIGDELGRLIKERDRLVARQGKGAEASDMSEVQETPSAIQPAQVPEITPSEPTELIDEELSEGDAALATLSGDLSLINLEELGDAMMALDNAISDVDVSGGNALEVLDNAQNVFSKRANESIGKAISIDDPEFITAMKNLEHTIDNGTANSAMKKSHAKGVIRQAEELGPEAFENLVNSRIISMPEDENGQVFNPIAEVDLSPEARQSAQDVAAQLTDADIAGSEDNLVNTDELEGIGGKLDKGGLQNAVSNPALAHATGPPVAMRNPETGALTLIGGQLAAAGSTLLGDPSTLIKVIKTGFKLGGSLALGGVTQIPSAVSKLAGVLFEKDFDESKHPRNEDGEFDTKEGGESPNVKSLQDTITSRTATAEESIKAVDAFNDVIDQGGFKGKDGETITREEVEAIRSFTGDRFRDVNNLLRSGDMSKIKEEVAEIDKALDKLPDFEREKSLSRGLNFADQKEADEFVKSITDKGVGGIIEFPAYMSTSKKRESGFSDFLGSKGVRLVIQSNKGKDISSLSNHPLEQEVLFPRGTKLKVAGARRGKFGEAIIRLIDTEDAVK